MLVSHFYYIVCVYDVAGYTNFLFFVIDIEKPGIFFGRIIWNDAHGCYECIILRTRVVFEVVAIMAFGSVRYTKGCLTRRIESYCNRARSSRIFPRCFEIQLQHHAVCILAGIIIYLKFRKTVNYMNEANIPSYTIYHVIFT